MLFKKKVSLPYVVSFFFVLSAIDVSATFLQRGSLDYLDDSAADATSIFVGNPAGASDNGNNKNTGLGIDALGANVDGIENVAVGFRALLSNVSGGSNVAVGIGTLALNVNGNVNTAVGSYAMASNVTGVNNVSMGVNSLYNNVNGSNNTAIGSTSLISNIAGSFNVAIGEGSLYNATGLSNVGIGYEAGHSISTGESNTLLGFRAGDNITTGYNNVMIGYNADAHNPVQDFQLNIANIIFGKNAGSGVDGSIWRGNIGIGIEDPAVRFHIIAKDDGDMFRLEDPDGVCDHNPEAGSEIVTCSSDSRFKENIVDAQSALEYYRNMRVREYDITESGNHMTGVIAQEMLDLYPELVHKDTNGYYKVEQPNMWKLVKAIQELEKKTQELDTLRQQNEEQQAEIDLLKEQMRML